MTRLTRRTALKLGAGAAAFNSLFPRLAFAQDGAGSHGISLFGDLKYQRGFTHLDYVNPDAPKGGRVVMTAPSWVFNQNPNTFNTLNSFVIKGDAPPRMELTFDALMAAAVDEPNSFYGLVAEGVEISDDENEVRFFLREEPRFHDGTPLMAEDVAFSINVLKDKGHPSLRLPLREVAEARAIGEREVSVRFNGSQSRELKLIVAALPIFSKRYHADKDIEASTLVPPLSSGPYKVGQVSAGRFVEYERVPDYWAADLPVNRGFNNFDVIRIEFYRERAAAFEAFKKGALTYREEAVSKTWATEYNFSALASGHAVKIPLPGGTVVDFQGFYFNTRRPRFSDAKTRRAVAAAFDFEWVNKNLFYGLYERSFSYFQNSEFEAVGLPSPEELAVLDEYRGELPPEVFGEPHVPPRSDGSGRDRRLLGEAARLLKEAGWERQGTVLARGGVKLTAEFLIPDPIFERALGPYAEALRILGVAASIRLVDPTQYERRQNDFDFDLIGQRRLIGAAPLEVLKDIFTSDAADTPSSGNLSGIKNPAVDALVERALKAENRESHRIILLALDRVLRAGHYAIPEWNKNERWVAIWDMFGRPEIKPDYAFPMETTWWFDAEKAARIGKTG